MKKRIMGTLSGTALVLTGLTLSPQAVAGSAVPAVSAASTVAAPNDNPGFLQVYDDNVENLPTVDLQCPGDWQDLVYYMQLQEYRPDVYVVQQISNQTQLDALTKRLSDDFGEKYSGVIAEANPAIGPKECGAPKYYQTNAIIYRASRLELTLSTNRTWQAQAQDSSGGCPNNTQARTKAVKAMFHDKVANKDLTVASVHWPTAASDGPPCATQNAAEVSAEMTEDGYGGTLQIAAGDLNYTDTATSGGTDFRTWYKSMNGDLGGTYGFRDAIYAKCAASGDPLGGCLGDNWTISSTRRIDFVFARNADGSMPAISAQHTVTFDEGDAADVTQTGDDRTDRNYSDHRAVMAQVHY